jgi:hypothetical protein
MRAREVETQIFLSLLPLAGTNSAVGTPKIRPSPPSRHPPPHPSLPMLHAPPPSARRSPAGPAPPQPAPTWPRPTRSLPQELFPLLEEGVGGGGGLRSYKRGRNSIQKRA